MMLRRTPLRPKRKAPRRNEGRVRHARIKAKASADPTAEQREYHAHLRRLGRCEACKRGGDLVIHHILASVRGKVGRRDHWYVVLLCPGCHNMRADSVHGLGSEAAFYRAHTVDLVAASIGRLRLWSDKNRECWRGAPKDEKQRSTRHDPNASEER